MTIGCRPSRKLRSKQRGQVLFVVLLILVAGIVGFFVNLDISARANIEREKTTAAALAQAKAALIGFAAGIDVATAASRPGDLPCPDMDNDGTADTPCSGGALGRFPWKRLGLPDLRDGDGERLWYAVSSNFKNNPRTPCGSPGDPGCLNSDSRGTITLRNASGAVINDGSNPDPFVPTGVIAIVFAPGRVLQRQGAAAPQDRSCILGTNCDAEERCTTSPPSLTPKCDPQNYLDVLSGTEDNASFVDNNSTDGFIHGDVRDATGNLIVNDRLMVITYADLMPLLERRVAREVLNCLSAYALVPQNNGRYPWAAPIANVTPPYSDGLNTRFGRVPDNLLTNTQLGPDSTCTVPSQCMSDMWPAECSVTTGTWWNNWKEMVFYGVAQPSEPADPMPTTVPVPGACGGECPGPTCCLDVNPPSATADKRVVVVVAGKRLSGVAGGQPRTLPALLENYLEDDNLSLDTSYTQKPSAPTFNDVLLYQ